MAKRKINDYVFEPGISKDSNLFPKAYALLTANKSFLQAQVVAFINYNIANNIGVYNGYAYDSSKCFRDVGFFIDAVAHDLRYGGNVKSRQIAEYFWIDGEPQIRGNPQPEIQGQAYLRNIINNNIFTNTAVSPTYGQTSVAQTFISGQNAETGASTRNTTLWNIFGDVIENGVYNIPAKVTGVSSIRILGDWDLDRILLITDTSTGTILYNFADPANTATVEKKKGYSSSNQEPLSDLDFAFWWQASDAITTINLSADTSALTSTTDIQIFVEEDYMTIKPWDFGTDAIERMRVAAPQAMLDADFEYGLQPTKWQAITTQRGYPSLYEIPGTDYTVTNVRTDASSSTAFFGASRITVTTSAPHGLIKGDAITIRGLSSAVSGYGRAEGAFLIDEVPEPNVMVYFASAKVGVNDGDDLTTSFVQLREANFYTGASIGSPTFEVVTNGSSGTITTKFTTPADSNYIAFTGTAPTTGSPITGAAGIIAGTSISGVNGSGTVTANVAKTTTLTDTSIEVVSSAGLNIGMAIENGAGSAVFINNILGNTINLSDQIGIAFVGQDGTNTGVTSTNQSPIGNGAAFTVSRSAGVYTILNSEDSTVNGQNYQIGDRILLTGDNLGGTTPANDATVFVTEVDSGGAILEFTSTGTSITGGATYTGVSQSSSTGSGINATVTVVRVGGTGAYQVTLTAGGSGHQPGDLITFAGTDLGGLSPDNDLVITVQGVSFGTEAIVDWAYSSGIGITGDQTYTGIAGTNVSPAGSGAIFTVVRSSGLYQSVTPTTGGSNYAVGDKLVLTGNQMAGATPLNDLTIRVTAVNAGAILSAVVVDGSVYAGDEFSVYNTVLLSEPTIDSIAEDLVLDVGAIPVIEVTFTNNHGLIPGNTLMIDITSTPTPTWESTASVIPTGNYNALAYGNFGTLSGGRVVAVRNGANAGAYSDDGGETWTSMTPGANQTWISAAYGVPDPTAADGIFVVFSSTSAQQPRWSNDGITWNTMTTNPASATYTCVAWSQDDLRFVAVRSAGTSTAISTDGKVWSAGGVLTASATWQSVTAGKINGVVYWVAISRGATTANYSITSGATWVAMGALPSTSNWESVAYGNQRFVCVASNATSSFNCAYSTDGTTWTGVLLPGTASAWNHITYTGKVFVVTGTGTNRVLISYTGEAGSWEEVTQPVSSNWDNIVSLIQYDPDYNDYATRLVSVGTSNNTVSAYADVVYPNHDFAGGNIVISNVPSLTKIRYSARSTGIIDTASTMTGNVYSRTDAFFTHRPFDGGVQLGCGGPQHGSQAIRQSKKYIRYQSGKGIMYTTGALFAPSYNLASATASDTAVDSFITFTVDEGEHGMQPGGVVEVVGMNSFEYNDTFTVDSIITSQSFRVRTAKPLTTTTGSLGPDAKVIVKYWHGSSVRTGPFDDQNGLFFQYDGQFMAVVKRSSTLQIAGTIAVNTDSSLVTGTGTRFQDQLKVGDKVVVRGMTHIVTAINSQTSLTFTPDFRGVNNITGAKMCLTQDIIVPQTQWNLDRLDGTGPSGYILQPWRMQMIGIQYSWYAAGFIEFMLRGEDGKFIFFHRIRNSNVNYEAYMRTANLPVRYEVENASARSKLRAAIDADDTTMTLSNAHYFPNSGTVYIDNELISYSGKTGNNLTGLTRSATLSNFNGGQNRSYQAGAAASHAINSGVILVSNTISPVISHWGSALLTDGMFDEDRGYLFSYAATNISVSTTRQTAFLIRLAPSVSNAIIGDLGERDLLNRAQLLLKEISLTTNAQATADFGGLVVEGILNPQNYPVNADDIGWAGISSVSNGGQPSFAQLASGGSVSWNSGVATTVRNVPTDAGRNITNADFLYFDQATFAASGVTVGTEVQAGGVWPAGTAVREIFGPGDYIGGDAGAREYFVRFNRSFTGTINAGTNVPFVFGQPPYALPGETVFSFIANPGERGTLDLEQLKELTTTAIGGRGTFPNGPDVLAINVYKVGGAAVNANIILRWTEAQA